MDSLDLFKDFKKRVIQYYLDNNCDNYTIEFGEDWRGHGFLLPSDNRYIICNVLL